MTSISVLMPVYNTNEQFLREAIESILNQTYKDFEFVIINDGSTNNAKDVILSYKDSRIKTLNKGLDLAKGQYIVRMDSDDISQPNRIEVSLRFMDRYPQISAAGTHAVATPKKFRYATPTDNEIITPFLRYIANCMMHPTMIIRKEVLDKYNLRYDEKYIHNEDYKLWVELNKVSKLANIPEVLLVHRLYDDAVSTKYATLQQHITFKIICENILESFAPRGFLLKNIVDKYFNDKKITILDLYIVINFIKKVVKILKKRMPKEFDNYINNTYKGVFLNFLKRVYPSQKLVKLVKKTKILEIIGYNDDAKNKLIDMIINKASQSVK